MRKRSKKNKMALKVAAMVLSITVAGTAVYGVGRVAFSDKASSVAKVEAKEKTDSEKLNDAVNTAAGVVEGSEASDKTETVYVITDGDCKTKEIIVSDHLKNTDKMSTIKDATDLTDLENTKGNEEYTSGTGNSITWDAQGNDIYYQGKSSKSLPVAVNMTYELDGKTVTADQIAGQSGHVKIRLDYENYEKVTEKVNGKNYEVYVPFACVSGMMLDSSKFTNVKVTNGTVISEGENQVALGYAFPGLEESLGIGTEVLKDEAEDIDIPEYVEIEADVDDFELSLAMTVATPNALNDLDIDTIDTKDMDEDIDDMEDAADKLLDGTAELSDGADTLADSMATASDGADQLATGVDQVVTGLTVTLPNSLQSAIDQYTGAASMLEAAKENMTSKTTKMVTDASFVAASAGGSIAATAATEAALKQVYANAIDQTEGETTLPNEVNAAATDTTSAYINSEAANSQITQALALLNNGDCSQEDMAKAIQLLIAAQSETSTAKTTASDATTILAGDGTKENPGLVKEVVPGLLSLSNEQKKAISDSVESTLKSDSSKAAIDKTVSSAIASDQDAVTAAATQFGQCAGAAGAVTALTTTKNSIETSFDSTSLNTLNKGAAKLADGTVKLTDGSEELAKGAEKLNSGMSDFKEQAIDKLVDLYKNDIKGLKNRLDAVQQAGEDYTIFTKLADGAEGKVTFIFKTDAVKLDDDK